MKRFIILSVVGVIFASIVSLFVFSSHLVRWAFNSQFETQQLSLNEELSVAIDPFSASLSISNFALMYNQDTPLIELSALNLDLELLPLFDKQLIVNNVNLKGLDLSIKVDDDGNLLLNGWDVNNFATSDKQAEKTSKASSDSTSVITETQSEALLKNISVNEVTLSNFSINANISSNSHNIDLSSLKLSNTELVLKDYYKAEKLSLNVELDTDYQLNEDSHELYVSTGITANFSPTVTWLPSGLKITGTGNTENTANSNKNSEEPNEANNNSNSVFEIKPTKAVILEQDVSIALNSLTLDVTDLSAGIENADNNQQTVVKWAVSSDIKNLLAQTVETNKTMLDVELTKFNSTRGQLVVTNDSISYEITLDALGLDNIVAMRDEEQNLPTMVDLTSISIEKVNLRNDGLTIDKVIIGEMTTNVIVAKNKSLANLYLPATKSEEQVVEPDHSSNPTSNSGSSSQEANATESAQTTQQDKDQVVAGAAEAGAAAEILTTEPIEAQPKFRIGEITNEGVFNLNTLDLSVDPNYRSLITVNTLNVSTIDNQQRQQVITLKLDANNNTYSKIIVNAEAQPFLEQPKHNVNINIDELDLSAISPYLSSALGYHINTGQLDSKVVANIHGDKIKGEADLLMRSMDLTAISNQGEESSFSGGAISFNYALGMLKDGDGHVDLNVPFEGDLNNPSVGFSGFLSLIVKRATMSAAKDYLINTFVPYANVVNFAITAGRQVLKLRFNDMALAPQESELDDAQKERLGNLAKVLTKHDSTNIKMCPISVIADLKEDIDEEAISKKSITADQVQTLLNLAQERAKLAKTFLVKQGNIPSKRILSCTPTIDYSVNGIPRLSFNET